MSGTPLDRRTKVLLDAKKAESKRKREQAMKTVERLLASGSKITFARVARESDVSTWLVYNIPEIRASLTSAIDKQREIGYEDAHTKRVKSNLSLSSVRTDLAFAREEVKKLRAEKKVLTARLERVLWDDLHEADRQELIERISELEDVDSTKQSDLIKAKKTITAQTEQITELSEDLEASRSLTHALMRQQNASSQA